jgi:hypothetical protein
MTFAGPRAGPLAGPLAALGATGTLVVLLHGDGRDPTPALPMGLLAFAAAFLRTRALRVLALPAVCIFTFAVAALGGVSSDGALLGTLVFVRALEGACFALVLMPVALSSLRAGGTISAGAAEASLRRSPWAVAAGTAPLFGELSGDFFCAWLAIADRGTPFRGSRWEHGVYWLYGAAVASALAIAVADSVALARCIGAAGRIRRRADTAASAGPSPDPARSQPIRSLALSVVIDLSAAVAAAAVFYHRFVAPPE